MIKFLRNLVEEGGMQRRARAGDLVSGNPIITFLAIDSNQTHSVSSYLGGVLIRQAATVGRTDTTPTAQDIINALPGMDIGDSFMFKFSNASASTITFAAGTGVTLQGSGSAASGVCRDIVITRTGISTLKFTAL